jgi:hypothetical protein
MCSQAAPQHRPDLHVRHQALPHDRGLCQLVRVSFTLNWIAQCEPGQSVSQVPETPQPCHTVQVTVLLLLLLLLLLLPLL